MQRTNEHMKNETLEYLCGKENPVVAINPTSSFTYEILSPKSRTRAQIKIDYGSRLSKLHPNQAFDCIRSIQSSETNHY